MDATSVGVLLGSRMGAQVALQSLFWDQLAVPDLNGILQSSRRDEWCWPYSAHEMESLRDRRVMFNVPVQLRLDEHDRARFREWPTTARTLAAALRTQGIDAVSLLSELTLGRLATGVPVLRIAVDLLSIPDEAVPLAEVMELRAKHGRKLHALRRWACDVARGQLTGREMEEAFEDVAADYAAILQQKWIDQSKARVAMIVSTDPAVAESVADRRLGRAAIGIATIRSDKTRALPHEQLPPGQPISYAIHDLYSWRPRPGRLTHHPH